MWARHAPHASLGLYCTDRCAAVDHDTSIEDARRTRASIDDHHVLAPFSDLLLVQFPTPVLVHPEVVADR